MKKNGNTVWFVLITNIILQMVILSKTIPSLSKNNEVNYWNKFSDYINHLQNDFQYD